MAVRSRLPGVVALGLAMTVLAGCAGTNAVAQNNSGGTHFVAGNGAVQTPAPSDRPSAPAISGPLLGGGTFSLSADRGKVVVLNVWGSWCAPCRAEAHGLVSVAKQWKSSGVRFVGVDIRDNTSDAKAYVRHFAIPYPNVVDSSGQLMLQFKNLPPNSTPATVVIDRRGRIAALFSRAVLPEDLGPVLRRLTAEPA